MKRCMNTARFVDVIALGRSGIGPRESNIVWG